MLDCRLILFILSLFSKSVFSQNISQTSLHALKERLWFYNDVMACPSQLSSEQFLEQIPHPVYSSQELEDMKATTIYIRLPKEYVSVTSGIPLSYRVEFICDLTVRSSVRRCDVGNCFIVPTISVVSEEVIYAPYPMFNTQIQLPEIIINATSSAACRSKVKGVSLELNDQQCFSLPPRCGDDENTKMKIIIILFVILSIIVIYIIIRVCCNLISTLRRPDSLSIAERLDRMGRCFKSFWYRLTCQDEYRGPYQKI
ncbi:hypothetical protein Ahia01_001385900 [Argonauta hians]